MQRVGADLLDQHDQRRALAGRGGDQFAALEQVVAVARQMEVAAVFLAALLDHREVAILRILGHPVVDAGVLDRDPDHRMRGYVVDLFAAEINRAAVAQ